MRVGVVGSRDWEDELKVRVLVSSLPLKFGDNFTFVSGGAYRRTKEWIEAHPGEPIEGGVDFWAEDQARMAGYDIDIMFAKWDIYGKAAGMFRNEALVDSCNYVYIFWDGKSKGAAHVIRYCKRTQTPYEVIGK